METLFSDYKAEGGVQIARKQNRRADGEEVVSVTVESVELNPAIDPGLFKNPTE